MTVLALVGGWSLWILFVWLASGIASSYLAERKGYPERYGLATGLVLWAIGPLVWLAVPPKPESDWKTFGPFGSTRRGAAG